MASADPTDLTKMWELSLYERNRSPQVVITDNTEVEVSPQSLHSELMCPICLEVLKKTMTAKECLHRFCSDCIVTALRSGNKECPTCRKKLVSKRSLRRDPNFDLIISKIYPNLDEYEAHQTRVLEKLTKSQSQANLVQSINEGIKLQTQNRQQRIKKNPCKEVNESPSATISKPSTSSSQDNVIRTMVQTKVAKKLKSIMISEKEGPASTVDTSSTAECNGALKDEPVDEIELVLKPHPTVMASDNPFIIVLRENSVRYTKTTPNATVDHLSKYLVMRLTADLGAELPERALNFLIYVLSTADQFVLVKDLMDAIQTDLEELFENADSMHSDEMHANFNTIMKVGEAALKHSDAKIQIADSMQKLVSKYMNHLDIELQKCKKDLDFDKHGTTEGIEKKMEKFLDNGKSFEEKLTVASNCSDTYGLEIEVDIVTTNSQMDPNPLSYTLEQMSAGSSGITAAASETYVDSTKEIIGRTTRKSVSVTSLPELPICKKLPQSGGSNKKTKKHTKNVEQEKNNDSIDISIDKDKVELNERRYCLCNEIAYNTMIACDNKKCPYEWFHYQCVGIESPPSGKWYCPKCVLKLKKKRR